MLAKFGIIIATLMVAITLAYAPVRAQFSQPGSAPSAATVSSIASNPSTGTITTIGSTVTFTVNFNVPVTVTGSPQLNLATSTVASHAVYQSGSGSTALNFLYTVQLNAAENPVATTASAICTTSCGGATITNSGFTSILLGANSKAFGIALAPSSTSANGTVIAAPNPTTPIIDSTGVQWTTTGTVGTICTTPNCLVANGTVVGGASITQIAYVNNVVWQENAAGNWYSASYSGSTWTTPAGPSTQSPLPSTNGTLITTAATITNGVNAPAIVDSLYNDFTITSGAQAAVNGTTITAKTSVTAVCYVTGTVYVFSTPDWYPVATINGASTTFGSGSTTPPASGCGSGSQVAIGIAGAVVLSSNQTGASGYVCGPSGGTGGCTYAITGFPAWDAEVDQLAALMGRRMGVTYTSMNVGGNAASTWEGSAQQKLGTATNGAGNNLYSITLDSRTSPSSGAIPEVSWPMGESGDSTFSDLAPANIVSSGDAAIIDNVLGQFKTAGYPTLYLRLGWEMNGDWQPWSVTSAKGNAAAFKLAWQGFYTEAHRYAAANGMTVYVVFCPNNAGPSWNGDIALSTWVPSSAYIDIYSIDDYGGNGTTPTSAVDGFNYSMQQMIAYAKAAGKPIAGSEIGGLDATWSASYVSALVGAGVPISHWIFWDSDTAGSIADGEGSWSNPTDDNCTTSGTTTSASGGTNPCGANTPPANPTNPSYAYYWWQGFNSINGTISGNQ